MSGNKTAGDKTKQDDGSNPDHNSPFYLHPSDYPRQMHVNDVLTDGNYIDWAQEMQNFLFAKNKIGFIDRTLEKPETTSPSYMPWMRCDAMIKGWLGTAMEKNIRDSIKYATSAAEIWMDLQERFGKECAPRAYELKQSINTTRQDGASYYTKLRSLWDEASSILPTPRCTCDGCTCGLGKKLNDLKDKEKLYEFLMGLDNEYSIIKTQVLATKPTPSLGTAYHLVAEDEQQRSITAMKKTKVDPAAFQAYVSGKRDRETNPPTTKIAQKDTKRGVRDQIEHCTFCGRGGHNRDGCFKRIGYPEWWPGKGKQHEKNKPKASMVEAESNHLPDLNKEQYEQLIKMLSGNNNKTGNS